MSDCRVPMPAYERPGGYVCDAPRCPLAGPEAMCGKWKWRGECAEGEFRALVDRFSGYGDWSVHDWTSGGVKFYAKLFGPRGFVTIENYTWCGGGYSVNVRLRQPKGQAEWHGRHGLHEADGSLSYAVNWACRLAGIEGRSADD